MKKFTKLAVVCAISVASVAALVACNDKTPKYTVTFDTRGGTEVSSYTLTEGQTVERPKTTPTKEMFIFDDWYTDTTYTTHFEFGTAMPANNVTVYAGWIGESNVTVTYNANGGLFGDTAERTETGKVGAEFTATSVDPTRTGYKFGGWYTDIECNNAYTFVKYPTDNLTLYACWNTDPAYSYISYYGNGELISVEPVQKNSAFADPDLFGSDYEYDKWYTDPEMVAPYAQGNVDADIKLYTSYYTKGLEIDGNTVTGYNGSATSVVIPAKHNGAIITAIGEYAFYISEELKRNITSVNIPATVTTIGEGAFYDCKYLVDVNLSDKVTVIGANAFWQNNRLKSIGNIQSVQSIGGGAFAGCSVLRNIELPATLNSLGDSAFADCDELTEITVPTGVHVIYDNLFSGCDRLVSVTIASPSLEFIGKNAFGGCSALTRVTINSVEMPEFADSSVAPFVSPFKGSDKVKIYVPANRVAAYKASYGFLDDGALEGKFAAIE